MFESEVDVALGSVYARLLLKTNANLLRFVLFLGYKRGKWLPGCGQREVVSGCIAFSASRVDRTLTFIVLTGFVANCVFPSCCSLVLANALVRYSMTTAVSAHLVVLANENGGGFNVQPGQQQAGGTVQQSHKIVMLQRCTTPADTTYTNTELCPDWSLFPDPSLPGPSSGHPVWPGGGCVPGSLLRGPPGCQAGLFFSGWHGPREHEGLWWARSHSVSWWNKGGLFLKHMLSQGNERFS